MIYNSYRSTSQASTFKQKKLKHFSSIWKAKGLSQPNNLHLDNNLLISFPTNQASPFSKLRETKITIVASLTTLVAWTHLYNFLQYGPLHLHCINITINKIKATTMGDTSASQIPKNPFAWSLPGFVTCPLTTPNAYEILEYSITIINLPTAFEKKAYTTFFPYSEDIYLKKTYNGKLNVYLQI